MSPFPLRFGSRQGGGGFPFSFNSYLLGDAGPIGRGTDIGIERRQGSPTTAGGMDLAALYLWKQLADNIYLQILVRRDSDGSAIDRYNWSELWCMELYAYYTYNDLTRNGTSLVSSFANTPPLYIGVKAARLATDAQYVEYTFTDHAGDLFVVVAKGADKGIGMVTINGSTDLVTLPTMTAETIPSGVTAERKVIDCYAASTARNTIVRVAHDLPLGTYTLRVTGTARKNASASGATVDIEAFATKGTLSDPKIKPPRHQTDTVYAAGDEVIGPDGWAWHTNTGGTSASTPPTPSTVGTNFTDGTVTWRRYFNSTYMPVRRFLVGHTTEREYALEVTINAVTGDIGGATHGNDDAVSSEILVDGEAWNPASEYIGYVTPAQSSIQINELLKWTHPEDADVADVQFNRTLDKYGLTHQAQITWNVDCTAGWVYPIMLGVTPYVGSLEQRILETARVGSSTEFDYDDYISLDDDVDIDLPPEYAVGVQGALPVDSRSHPFAWVAGTTPATMAGGALLDLWGRMNIPIGETPHPDSGSNNWTSKFYFQRSATSTQETVQENDTMTWDSYQVWALSYTPYEVPEFSPVVPADLPAPVDIDDDFSSDTSSEWNRGSGSVDGTIAVSAGQLVHTQGAGDGAQPRFVRTVGDIILGRVYEVGVEFGTDTASTVSFDLAAGSAGTSTIAARTSDGLTEWTATQETVYVALRLVNASTGQTGAITRWFFREKAS